MLTGMNKRAIVKAGIAALGRKGGKARAEALSRERRIEIARMAAKARWNGHVKS